MSALACYKFVLEIRRGSIKRDDLGIIELRDVDTETMMERDDEVEEIHRVDIQGFEGVTMQVDGMVVAALVGHDQAIVLSAIGREQRIRIRPAWVA